MEELAKTAKITSSSSSPTKKEIPWLDLPDPLTDLILELLPLPEYIRFGSVCRKWRSIQRNHRLHHSPPTRPWLIPHLSKHPLCYSPFDQTLHRLPLPVGPHTRCLTTCRGWLLLIDDVKNNHSSICPFKQPYLLNPIFGDAQIRLPLLMSISTLHRFLGAMSAPPTDPHCTLLVQDDDRVFLCRVSERWTSLHLPRTEAEPVFHWGISTAVFFGGKFYCISRWFMVVDPICPNPSVRFLEMNRSQLPDEVEDSFLVEANGELLLVVALFDYCGRIEGFQVFRADLSEMIWVRVEGLGDCVLFVNDSCAFSLLAADVGCKKNCIYYTKVFAWGNLNKLEVFDLDTGTWIDGPLLPGRIDKDHFWEIETGHWFVPALDYVNPA